MSDYTHPCDPLSVDELNLSTSIVKEEFGADAHLLRFGSVRLEDYPKDVVWDYDEGKIPRPPRISCVTHYNVKTKDTYETLVNITSQNVISTKTHAGVTISFIAGDSALVEEVMRSDPKVIEFCRHHNIDPEDLCCECWATGWYSESDNRDRRTARPLTYIRDKSHNTLSNPYSRPLDGLLPEVDLVEGKIISWHRYDLSVPIPPAGDIATEFDKSFHPISARRAPPKPLVIQQPRGANFVVKGSLVEWEDMSVRVGFDHREGLVLYDLKVQKRPVVFRASFNEMVVPYGDPTLPNARKNAFDAGEDGLGCNANSLELGCDCMGRIHYMDGCVTDALGSAIEIKNAICIHEEDAGVLYTHTDWRNGRKSIKRARKLVFQITSTIANYDYIFAFHLRMDGTLESVVKMTGILSTSVMPNDEPAVYGSRVSNMLVAPVHQHFFVARYDMAVDGPLNSVDEVDMVPTPLGPGNPFRNAFRAQRTLIESEEFGGRDFSSLTARQWIINSSSSKNRFGDKTAYRLMPPPSSMPFAHNFAPIMNRASFLRKGVWITQTDVANRRFVSGAFPNQRGTSDGVHEWVKDFKPLVDKPITLWVLFGYTHLPAPEQWPIMCVEHMTCMLQPFGFFDKNPTLDAWAPEDLLEERHSSQLANPAWDQDGRGHQKGSLDGGVTAASAMPPPSAHSPSISDLGIEPTSSTSSSTSASTVQFSHPIVTTKGTAQTAAAMSHISAAVGVSPIFSDSKSDKNSPSLNVDGCCGTKSAKL